MEIGIGEIVKSVSSSGPLASLGDAWQAVIGDRIAHWRLRNAMALQIKANDEARHLGLQLVSSRIPERYAFAWFEEATKQDEPELQVLFARLLAKAAAGDEDASDRRLLKILGAMTPSDAAVFQRIYSNQPFPGTGAYEQTKSIVHPTTMDRRKVGWPRNWAEALIENFHPEHAKKTIEQLLLIGVLSTCEYVEGEPNAGFLASPMTNNRPRTSWRKFVQAHAATRQYLVATEIGRSLSAALSVSE